MPYQAKLLRIHCSESDRSGGKPLYVTIVELCKSIGIAGATVFRGLEGYGETGEIHHRHLVTHDQPVVITIADTPENIERLLAALEPVMDTGMIAISDATAIRVQKGTVEPNV
jgi:PII-like signaling protein